MKVERPADRERDGQSRSRRQRMDLALVASYIHELSPRHRSEREAREAEAAPEAAAPELTG